MTAPLLGLVLAGGRSTRMGQDKAALAYHGATQLDWAMSLIAPFVERAYVSVRPDQIHEPVRAKYPQIIDTLEGKGPIAGIIAAQAQHPEAAWLVLACDLPFLDATTLTHLLSHRQPMRLATAYRSSHDDLPEPLCAVYEPASREALAAYVAGGKQCPRNFLMQTDAQLIDALNPRALDNVNTPAEHGSASSALDSNAQRVSKRVHIQYYALLREQAKQRQESMETTARNPMDLYDELQRRYSFSLPAKVLRVAVNGDFGSWTQPLREGDSVVFIPPVAGG